MFAVVVLWPHIHANCEIPCRPWWLCEEKKLGVNHHTLQLTSLTKGGSAAENVSKAEEPVAVVAKFKKKKSK